MANYLNGYDNESSSMSESDDNGINRCTRINNVSPPLLQGMVRIASSSHIIPPDSEENVEAQTGDIFLNYVYQSYRLETSSPDSTLPSELLNFNNVPLSPAAEIGRQLATLGDNITQRYSLELDDMITSVIDVDAYEAFASIARRVFISGIRWHRILVLLNFGYRLAVAKLQHSASEFSSFLSRIISFIVKFIVSEKIARWIAQRGGWRAALRITQGTSTPVFMLVSAMAALSIFAVIAVRKFL